MCFLQSCKAWMHSAICYILKFYEQLFDSVAKLSVENIENAKTLEELI